MEEKKNSNAANGNAIDGLASSVSKGINAFRVQKELQFWGVIGIVVVVVGYFIVRAIKKSALNNIPLPELPTGGEPIADADTYKQEAQIMAKEVKSVTDGLFTLANTKEKVFAKLYAMSDRDLLYVYRVYNSLYYTKSQETMTQAIEAETNYVPEFLGGVKGQLVNRLTLLGGR